MHRMNILGVRGVRTRLEVEGASCRRLAGGGVRPAVTAEAVLSFLVKRLRLSLSCFRAKTWRAESSSSMVYFAKQQ
jgi:hypothetical protein